jgi:hypothetical protein
MHAQSGIDVVSFASRRTGRTNALNEEEQIERNTIRKIQYDLRISESNGEGSGCYYYTLNALLHSGEKVFLVEYCSTELDESRYFINFLVMRLEQALNLPRDLPTMIRAT